MAAQVLTHLEQKNTLSGKKKKKTIKNTLGLPNNIKVESYIISVQEADKLKKILERLLPTAKLPSKKSKNCNIIGNLELSQNQVELLEQAKKKRNQLSIGVNALSRNIKKKIISSVLLASDIQPKFLVHHINLLCNFSKIPLLHIPGLRLITHKTLGFPCICLGFKQNSDFFEVAEEIKSLFASKKNESKNIIETSSDSCTSEEDESNELMHFDKSEKDFVEFDYLHRDSLKQRVFVPDVSKKDTTPAQELGSEFISLNKYKDDMTCNSPIKGISSNLVMKSKKKKKLSNLKDLCSTDLNDEEDFKVFKKKIKKDWIIDKVGTKQKFKYSTTNVYKLYSNPQRVKNKNK